MTASTIFIRQVSKLAAERSPFTACGKCHTQTGGTLPASLAALHCVAAAAAGTCLVGRD